MSHISVRGEQSSDTEIAMITALANLAVSGASQAIRKTGASSFANLDVLTPTTAASTYVPYTGATTNVNVGSHSLSASGLYAYDSGNLIGKIVGIGSGTSARLYLIQPGNYEAILEAGDGYLQSSGPFAARIGTDSAGFGFIVSTVVSIAGPLATFETASSTIMQMLMDGSVGVGTATPDRRLHSELDASSTNSVLYPFRMTRTSSGTPATGIGAGLEFEVETSANNNEIGALIEAVTTDVTSTSEDFDLVFKNMKAGAAADERLRVTSNGIRIKGNGGTSYLDIKEETHFSQTMMTITPNDQNGSALGVMRGYLFVKGLGDVPYIYLASSDESIQHWITQISNIMTFNGASSYSFDNIVSTSYIQLNAAGAPSLVEGIIWNDSTQKSLIGYVDGIKQSLVGTLFTQTADKSVTNTTTETSIIGTGVGSLTLPANFFVAGKTIRVTMSGVYSTVAVTGDTVTVKVKYGSTILASKATTALVTGGTNLAWFAEALITCRSTGSSGTVQVSGGLRYQVAGSAIIEDELNNSVATSTLNTTTSNLFDVTVTHGAANASNTVKSLVGAFEVLY